MGKKWNRGDPYTFQNAMGITIKGTFHCYAYDGAGELTMHCVKVQDHYVYIPQHGYRRLVALQNMRDNVPPNPELIKSLKE